MDSVPYNKLQMVQGSKARISILRCISVPVDCLNFSKNSVDYDYYEFHLGIHCLPKYTVFQVSSTVYKQNVS